jgi:hypothetical protein
MISFFLPVSEARKVTHMHTHALSSTEMNTGVLLLCLFFSFLTSPEGIKEEGSAHRREAGVQQLYWSYKLRPKQQTPPWSSSRWSADVHIRTANQKKTTTFLSRATFFEEHNALSESSEVRRLRSLKGERWSLRAPWQVQQRHTPNRPCVKLRFTVSYSSR